jgi:aldehyde:ferredoxin oxidoreductase
VHLSTCPHYQGKDSSTCPSCPAHCHVHKTVAWKNVKEHHHSDKHTQYGSHVPTQFVIGTLETAAKGEMMMLSIRAS